MRNKNIAYEHRKKIRSENISNLHLSSDATCNMQKVFLLFLPCCIAEFIKFRLFLKTKKLHGKTLGKVVN